MFTCISFRGRGVAVGMIKVGRKTLFLMVQKTYGYNYFEYFFVD